jgi:ligand-binding SRPBCC domain-containing protein
MAHLQLSQVISAPRFAVYDFLTDPSQLKQLLQPIIEVQLLSPVNALKRGGEVHFKMTRLGLTQSVCFRIEDVLHGSRLTYRQIEGLFASWTHTTKFVENGEGATLVTDIVDYTVPFGLLGTLLDDLLTKRDLRRLLEHRLAVAQRHFVASETPS